MYACTHTDPCLDSSVNQQLFSPQDVAWWYDVIADYEYWQWLSNTAIKRHELDVSNCCFQDLHMCTASYQGNPIATVSKGTELCQPFTII